jgi:hypothetical protein
VITAVFVTALIFLASTASARMAAICSTKQTPARELRCGKANLHHADSLRRFLKAHPWAGTYPERVRLTRDHRWLRRYALRHIATARARMIPPIPHLAGWLCIHSHEGSWTDSGDPYWGGLQMDRQFMESYGADMIVRFHGYANVWPVWAQMVVAERAYSSGRGYGPWPNTARACGL